MMVHVVASDLLQDESNPVQYEQDLSLSWATKTSLPLGLRRLFHKVSPSSDVAYVQKMFSRYSPLYQVSCKASLSTPYTSEL